MTANRGWRRLVACAMIDAILIVSAGAAMAAPVTPVAGFVPHVPALLMLGIGMVGVTRVGRKHG